MPRHRLDLRVRDDRRPPRVFAPVDRRHGAGRDRPRPLVPLPRRSSPTGCRAAGSTSAFSAPAQIDRFANLNSTVIGDLHAPQEHDCPGLAERPRSPPTPGRPSWCSKAVAPAPSSRSSTSRPAVGFHRRARCPRPVRRPRGRPQGGVVTRPRRAEAGSRLAGALRPPSTKAGRSRPPARPPRLAAQVRRIGHSSSRPVTKELP